MQERRAWGQAKHSAEDGAGTDSLADRRVAERLTRLLPELKFSPRERSQSGYVIPLGLVALGLLGALEMSSGGLLHTDLPVAPLIFAAIVARAFGLRTARVAAALIAPLLVCAMRSKWDADFDDMIWAAVHLGGLIALCVDVTRLRGWIAPSRRSPAPRRPSPPPLALSPAVRSYVWGIGLMAAALMVSVEEASNNLGFLPLTPELAAVVFARILGGLTAARVAVAIASPITLYVGWTAWGPFSPVWFGGYVVALVGLCIERAELSPRPAPDRPQPRTIAWDRAA